MTLFDGKSVLVTGGTGSFGKTFIRTALDQTRVKRIAIFSRDELKQWEMSQQFAGEDRLRFFIGDVRDPQRLLRAMDGVDYVVHAAALKQVPAAEYNPFEAVQTNILGARNVIDAAIDRSVRRVIALSTDKASSPINLYGATKLVSDKLFIDGNAYAGSHDTRFAVVRYGNVVGSRGSVIPFFRQLAPAGKLPITDPQMTRFWITLDHGVQTVFRSFELMQGGEIFVPKIPSMRVVDLARAIAPDADLEEIGIRSGEKLHEELISTHDARHTVDLRHCYAIEPAMDWWEGRPLGGERVAPDFHYTSDRNDQWLSVEQLREMIKDV
jgi:UDP-N-acetylglucosamine 4,6-dehydratase